MPETNGLEPVNHGPDARRSIKCINLMSFIFIRSERVKSDVSTESSQIWRERMLFNSLPKAITHMYYLYMVPVFKLDNQDPETSGRFVFMSGTLLAQVAAKVNSKGRCQNQGYSHQDLSSKCPFRCGHCQGQPFPKSPNIFRCSCSLHASSIIL